MSGLVMVMPYRAYVEKAKEEGYSVYAIWDPEVARGIYGIDSPGYLDKLAATADGFELADFSDLDGLERAIVANASGPEVQYVYHLGAEETMLATYRVAAKLGKAVNPVRSIELLNDKLEMRRLLEREGLSPVRFAEAPSWRAAEPLLKDFPLPLVLKPTSLSGSRGVYLLRDRSQYRDWGQLLDGYGYDGPVLLEEYLKGPEFSVETLSCAGRHRVIGVTKKVLGPPPLFVEMGHVHPFEDEQMAAHIGETAIALLDAAGYMCGPAHTEVIWGPAGPRIVESQARLGGDRIPQLVQLSTGVDMERGIFQCLSGHFPDGPTKRAVARISYFDFSPGVVRSVSGFEAASALDWAHEVSFHHRVGDVLPPTVDWRSRHGYVVVEAANAQQAADRVARVESMISVVTTPAPLDQTLPAPGAPVQPPVASAITS